MPNKNPDIQQDTRVSTYHSVVGSACVGPKVKPGPDIVEKVVVVLEFVHDLRQVELAADLTVRQISDVDEVVTAFLVC